MNGMGVSLLTRDGVITQLVIPGTILPEKLMEDMINMRTVQIQVPNEEAELVRAAYEKIGGSSQSGLIVAYRYLSLAYAQELLGVTAQAEEPTEAEPATSEEEEEDE